MLRQRRVPGQYCWLLAFGFCLSLFGVGLGSAPASAGFCPEYPGQTHEQIVYKIESRLHGNWKLAIQTTQRAVKRQKNKGEDASLGQLFVEVLTCLQQEVKDGYYADVVEEARDNTKGKSGGNSASASDGSATGVETAQVDPGGASSAPVEDTPPAVLIPLDGSSSGNQQLSLQPAPEPQVQPQVAQLEPVPAAPPINAPAPAVSVPPASFNQGVALPGTAESYAPSQPATTAPKQQAALPANGDYTGQACIYFTRPYEEWVDGVRHINRYSDGEWVCNADVMYACAVGAWQNMGNCKQYSLWETRLSTTLESKPR